MAAAPLGFFTQWYIGLLPIIAAVGWITLKGSPDNQKHWNALHGFSQRDKRLNEAMSAMQAARKAILLGDLSPVIVHELSMPLDKLEDNLEKYTLSGKAPAQETISELISAARDVETAAIRHQDIDNQAADEAKSKAKLLQNTSDQLR